jgi:hypothetical protein
MPEGMSLILFFSIGFSAFLLKPRLCKGASNNMGGVPFVPIKAVAVDLFPHTPHCELVVLFERANSAAAKAAVEVVPEKKKLAQEENTTTASSTTSTTTTNNTNMTEEFVEEMNEDVPQSTILQQRENLS